MRPIALCCADIHLSHKAPLIRSAEPDWYAAQARPLRQLEDLQDKYEVPILCAGDIFNSWKEPAETINFALQYLPPSDMLPFLAVAGNHEIPNHQRKLITGSPYWTLVMADKIGHLHQASMSDFLWEYEECLCAFYGCSFGDEIIKPEQEAINIAVVHKFIWSKGHGYKGCPPELRADKYQKDLKGYQIAVFGDNHNHFISYQKNCTIYNCGCLIRRKADEIGYEPSVGLLHSDGSVKRLKLDCSEDKFIELEEALDMHAHGVEGATEFITELINLGKAGLDFVETVRRWVRDNHRKLDPRVKAIILEALGDYTEDGVNHGTQGRRIPRPKGGVL